MENHNRCLRLGANRAHRWIPIFCALSFACISSVPAFAQCTLNGSSDPTCTLPPSFNTYTVGNNTIANASGTISNNVSLTLTSAANNSVLNMGANTTLQGGGSVFLTQTGGGAPILQQTNSGVILENVNNNIQGSGIIGNGGLTLANDSGGTINANSSGQLLLINSSGGVTNQGLMTATSGGTLELQSVTATNTGGNITANGGSVAINSAVINGGTLNTSGGGTLGTISGGVATINGVTISTGSTYTNGNNADVFVSGTLTNNGNIQLTSVANSSVLGLNAGTVLTGGGTVTMTQSGGGSPYIQQQSTGLTLENFNNTIQGAGTIGNSGLTLTNDGAGTVSANATGQTLLLNGSGGVTNNGLLNATNGGTLQLQSITVANDANITADNGAVVFQSSIINGGTLNSVNGGTLQTFANGTSTLNGVTISSGSTYTTGNNTDLYVSGTITNNGAIQVNSAANNTAVILSAGTTLTGGGTVTLAQSGAGGASYIEEGSTGLTLENVNNTIQGAGTIGNGALIFTNDASGSVLANTSGQTLVLNGSGGVTNNGVMKATNGGTMEFSGVTVTNNTGITADNGTVIVNNSAINGGNLTTLNGGAIQTAANGIAYLNGVTISSGSTYTNGNNSNVYITGTITNQGNIQVNATANSSILLTNAAGTTLLNGGGTVSLTQSGAGGTAYIEQSASGMTLENFNNTIQGAGVIGNNGLILVNDAGGTVNANLSGQTLSLTGAGHTNQGLLEATSGGVLEITGSTINNVNGNITGNGGTVVLNSSTIQGGTLNGAIQIVANGVATLDGTSQGSILLSTGTTLTAGNNTQLNLNGTITNQGNIQVNTTANNTIMLIAGTGTTLLNGGGTVTLTNTNTGAQSYVEESGGGQTLENFNNTIQGAGVLGNNGLVLQNDAGGTVNANSSGQVLSLTGATHINQGLLEATNGGILEITSATINNLNGNITGNGGTVVMNSSTIQGGTLNGAFQISTNGTATLDGTTQGAITMSAGTTFAAGNDTQLNLNGTIANNGDIQLTSAANTTLGFLQTNTTLNGTGTLTLSSGASGTIIEQASGGLLLTNNGNTIQGAGTIGNNGLSVTNNAGGTILANASGQTLLLNSSGTLINAGTLQANAGSTLLVAMNVDPGTYSAGTLSTGTYKAYGTAGNAGTLQINALGTSGGGEIVTNNATILLSGANSLITDASGTANALSALATNGSGASFSLVSGATLSTSAAAFSNTGFLDIGATSSLTINSGSGTYTQSTGTTQVDGLLDAAMVDITGGLLTGIGTVDPVAGYALTVGGTSPPPAELPENNDFTISATVQPGDGNTTGTLIVDGNYDQTSQGILLIGLESTSLYDALDIEGNATFAGSLNFDLLEGFQLQAGDTFDIVGYDFRTGSFNANFSGLDLAPGLTAQIVYNDETCQSQGQQCDLPLGSVELEISGTASAAPEPSTWFLFAGGLGVLALFRLRKVRATLSPKR